MHERCFRTIPQSGWCVYDAAANGTSAALCYRRHFHDLVRRYGPDALLK
jgi:ABC-type transporter MlaC component